MSLPVIVSPLLPAPAPAPSSSIKGVPVYPGCVVPSMVTGAVIAGSGERMSIVFWPVPMAKAIVPPPCASAFPIASRSEPGPESAAVVTW